MKELPYTCGKPYCYYCSRMFELPRPQTVMMPIIIRNPNNRSITWTEEERKVFLDNILLPNIEIQKMVPRHTLSAVCTRKTKVSERLGITLRGRWGSI